MTLAKELQLGTAGVFISRVLANTVYPYIQSVHAEVESGRALFLPVCPCRILGRQRAL